eukprot:8233778-Ditylum_brightwellii.AAC.1
MQFGNHKDATSKPLLLRNLIKKDVMFAYSLILPLHKIMRIPGALLAPMNIMRQNTIDNLGHIIEKHCLTHNQSYLWGLSTSVNSRVQKDKLLPCMFGYCAARRAHLTAPILASKIDYKSTYKRQHINKKVAVQTCTQLPDKDLAIMALQLTFGGTPGPYEWGVVSEAICDLANTILHGNAWLPDTLCSPIQHLVLPKRSAPQDVLMGMAEQLNVNITIDPRGTIDVYIDITIGLTVNLLGTDNVA